MRLPRPSSILVLAAGLLALAAGAQAQTRPAASDEPAKVGKHVQAAPAKPASTQRLHGKDEPKDDAGESDMIMLQEPFRFNAATPVSTHRQR